MGAVGGIGCGNLSLSSKRQAIVPGVPHSAPCLSSMEISAATTCSLWPLAGSWKVSQVSCSQPWLRDRTAGAEIPFTSGAPSSFTHLDHKCLPSEAPSDLPSGC